MEVIWFKSAKLPSCIASREDPLDDPSIRHFCLFIEDLAGMRRNLTAAGYAPYDVEAIPGRPRFFCSDPFGNIIEFTTIVGDYLAPQDS